LGSVMKIIVGADNFGLKEDFGVFL
jgi:hypothetical protein